ncbi:MAG: DMT family transporter [Microgenomates group bacterium]
MTTSRKLAYLALSFNVLVWGMAFPLIKPAFDFISPMQYLYFRFLVAGIISLPIFLIYYIKVHPKISYLIKVLFIELLGITIPLYLLYEGLSRTSAIDASLLGSIYPLFIVLGSVWFLHERENKREWQGLALALLGSFLLVVTPLLSQNLDTPSSTVGNLYILGYGLTYTIYAIVAKKIYKTKPPIFTGALTYLFTALIYGLILSSGSILPNLDLLTSNFSILLPVLYMAIPGGIIAFALHLYATSKIEVSEANVFGYLNGVVAIPASYLILGEKPGIITLIATAIIAYGVYRAEIRTK